MKDLTYEVKRRWDNFWRAMQGNPWYRRRLVGFGIVAFLTAGDLSFYLFGRTKAGVAIGVVLGLCYFLRYEKAFLYYNRSLYYFARFGLTATDQYVIWPTRTVALNCIVKLLWSRFEHRTLWLSCVILYASLLGIHLQGVLRRASLDLKKHEDYVVQARSFLRIRQSYAGDAEEYMLKLLKEWTNDVYGDAAAAKSATEAECAVNIGDAAEKQENSQ